MYVSLCMFPRAGEGELGTTAAVNCVVLKGYAKKIQGNASSWHSTDLRQCHKPCSPSDSIL